MSQPRSHSPTTQNAGASVRAGPAPSRPRSQTHASGDQLVLGKASAPRTPAAARTRTRAAVPVRLAPGSAPMRESIGQSARQSRGEDLRGRRRVIIEDATDRHRAGLAVPDRVAGARIAVARLADTAHVDEVPAAVVEAHLASGRSSRPQ